MIPITASFLKVLPDNVSVEDVEDLLSSNTILLVGPEDACHKLANSFKAVKENDKSEFGMKPLHFKHASALARNRNESVDSGVQDSGKPVDVIPYIIIISYEGARAMQNVEDSLSMLDIEYLKKPSVDVINWRSNLGDDTKDRTQMEDLVRLSCRFKIVVHTVYGDHQESIDKNALSLYNRMKTVVNHPQVRHYSSWKK